MKVLLGLGGWTDSAGDKYSRLVSSSAARDNFIEKLIPFLRMHNFQGLHFDWNYPVCWQSNCKKGARSDKANFAKFIQVIHWFKVYIYNIVLSKHLLKNFSQ